MLLADDLRSVHSRMRRMMWVRGVAWTLVAALGGGLLLGGLDSWVRWRHGWTRSGQSILWVFATAGIAWAVLWRPLRHRLGDVDLARRIHRRWPTLTPDLVSGVEFSAQTLAPQAGAPLLQQIVVNRASAQLATVPVETLLDRARVVRPVLGVVACLGLLFAVGLLRPEWLGIGLCRLTQPWADWDWPRRTTLVYLDAELRPIRNAELRTPQGETFTVYIEDRQGSLPSNVQFVRQSPDGTVLDEGVLPQATLRDHEGRPHTVAVANWPAVAASEFHATGGDDDRAQWLRVGVVQPPRIDSFTITVTPPAYTGLPAEVTDSSVGHLQGLVGSQVEVTPRTNSPLQGAQLHRGSLAPQKVPLTEAGQIAPLLWTIATEERDSYWLGLTDREGIASVRPPRYEIRGLRDEAPVVTLVKPDADQRVTPTAIVTLQGLARDDLGLKRVELVAELPGADGAEPATPRTLALGPTQVGAREQAVDFAWDLTEQQLLSGTTVRYWLQAVDAYDLNGSTGQIGRSAVRVLSIISPEDKRQELSGRRIELAERVDTLREKQAALEQTAREVRDQWATVGALRPDDRRDLERVATGQRELEQQLTDPQRGLLAELRSMQRELTANRLESGAELPQLTRWEQTLEPLAREVLPSVPPLLEAVRQATTPESPTPPSRAPVAKSLDQTVAAQQRVLADLSQLSDELAQWRQEEDLTRRVAELTTRQATLRDQSVQLATATAAQPEAPLTAQQQADLSRAADRQAGLAQEVDQLTQQMQASPTHGDLARRLDEQSIAARMREASDELRQNHVQSATAAQRELLAALESLRDEMALTQGRSRQNAVDELRKAVAETTALREQQEALRRRTAAWGTPSADSQRAREGEELKRLQSEAQQQAAELAQRLRRESHDSAAAAMKRAADRMQNAGEQLDQEAVEPALAQQQESLDDLDQASEALQKHLVQAERQAEEQALTALSALVRALLERQQAVREETARLEALRLSAGKWSRSQLKTLQQLAQTQTELADSHEPTIAAPETLRMVRHCLQAVVTYQRSAAQRIAERETGKPTQSDQRAAERLMEQFLASVAPPSSEESPSGTGPDNPPESSEEGPGVASTLAVELRLLLSMQEEIQQRTQELVTQKQSAEGLSPAGRAELEQLRRRQNELAIGTRELLESTAEELP